MIAPIKSMAQGRELPGVGLGVWGVQGPARLTSRTRSLPRSATSRLPQRSMANPAGELRCVDLALSPSPLNPKIPVPAIVVMVPAVSTLRMLCSKSSAM